MVTASELMDKIHKNQVGKGEKPTLPPAKTKDVAPANPKPLKKSKAKEKQPALIKVKLDSVGKCAKRLKQAIEELEAAQDEKGAASEALQKSMKDANRLTTSFDGYRFQLHHVGPKDTIKVDKPK